MASLINRVAGRLRAALGSRPDRATGERPDSWRRLLRLTWEIAWRDVRGRYAGASLGIAWLALMPASFLAIYWFVFGRLLGVTWPDAPGGGFLLPFFAGLAVHLFVADVLVSSPDIFVRRRDYVRRAPFPIWVLWLANLMRAGVGWAGTMLVVLLLALLLGALKPAGLLWLVAVLPAVLLFVAAISLCLSLLGPFLGDLQEIMSLATRVLFYAAPVTYPLTLVPEQWRWLIWLNPQTHIVEAVRGAVVFNTGPGALHFAGFVLAGLLLAALGLWLYRRVAGAVADVV